MPSLGLAGAMHRPLPSKLLALGHRVVEQPRLGAGGSARTGRLADLGVVVLSPSASLLQLRAATAGPAQALTVVLHPFMLRRLPLRLRSKYSPVRVVSRLPERNCSVNSGCRCISRYHLHVSTSSFSI